MRLTPSLQQQRLCQQEQGDQWTPRSVQTWWEAAWKQSNHPKQRPEHCQQRKIFRAPSAHLTGESPWWGLQGLLCKNISLITWYEPLRYATLRKKDVCKLGVGGWDLGLFWFWLLCHHERITSSLWVLVSPVVNSSTAFDQCFLDFNAHTNPLEILLSYGVWFGESEMGSGIPF